MSVSELNTLTTAINTAIAAEDWATAENKLLQKINVLDSLPSGKHGEAELDWAESKRGARELLNFVQQKKTAAAAAASTTGGIRFTKMQPTRTSAAS